MRRGLSRSPKPRRPSRLADMVRVHRPMLLAGLLVVLLLLVVPYGTIVAGYFLYCLSGGEAATLFTPEYATIRRATPELAADYWLRLWYGVGAALPLMGCAMFDSFLK